MTESKLMQAQGDFKCATCFYFRMEPTEQEVITEVPYCSRRQRIIGWNPVLFLCGSYGTKDGPQKIQTSLDWRWKVSE